MVSEPAKEPRIMIVMQGLDLKIDEHSIYSKDYQIILHTTQKQETFMSRLYYRSKWLGTIKTKILKYVN